MNYHQMGKSKLIKPEYRSFAAAAIQMPWREKGEHAIVKKTIGICSIGIEFFDHILAEQRHRSIIMHQKTTDWISHLLNIVIHWAY
jgi:hypothetical protein